MAVKQTLYYISAVFSLAIMMTMIIFSENGFMDMMKMKRTLSEIEMASHQISYENKSLCRKINRLKSDPEYIENIARNEMGMVAEDDMVILFKDRNTE